MTSSICVFAKKIPKLFSRIGPVAILEYVEQENLIFTLKQTPCLHILSWKYKTNKEFLFSEMFQNNYP